MSGDTPVRVYNLFFDSKYKLLDSDNFHPEFELENQITLSDPNNYFEFELVAADVPFSFYMFDIPNNVVEIRLERLITGGSLEQWDGEISIQQGNYNINQLCDAFSAAIATAWQNLPPGPTSTLLYTYNPEDGKVTFQLSTGAASDYFRVLIRWENYDIFALYFGFSSTDFTDLRMTGAVATYYNNISTYCVCVNPVTSLYLRSYTLNQSSNNQEILVDTTSSQSNILGKMAVNVASMNWIYYDTNDFKVQLRNSEIKRFDLFWSGLTYDEIRFRGVFWKIQVRIREMQPQAITAQITAANTARTEADNEARALALQKKRLAEEASARVNKIRKKVTSKLALD